MSHHKRRLFSPIAAMVGTLVIAMAAPARADLQIWAGTTAPLTSANLVASTPSGLGSQTVNYTGTIGDFSISALATSSDTPGTPTFASLGGSTVTITDTNTNLALTATLYISLGDVSYTGPTSPPAAGVVVVSNLGTTVFIGNSANTLSYQSYVNQDNSQNGTTGYTTGSQSVPITTVGANSNSTSNTFSPLSSPFSVTETFAITLSGLSSINFSTSTILIAEGIAGTPEPSSLAIAGVGALGLIGFGLRRRKALGA